MSETVLVEVDGAVATVTLNRPEAMNALSREMRAALPFGDGLALEHERSSAANAAVTPALIEARRAAVQARGRAE